MESPAESHDRRRSGPRFVGRERELKRLAEHLERAVSKEPQVCFVCGAAGAGKTALVRAFIGAIETDDETLVSAVGSCNAQTGQAQPYQPFLEVLAQLTGDVQAKLASGDITRAGAQRLSELVRASTKALVDHAPDLIGTLIPGSSLVVKATRYAAQEAGLLKKLEQRAEDAGPAPELDEKQIMQQYGQLLAALAEDRPLVLVLDDLQWADEASVGLLYHLVQHLEDCRVLLIGAFRAFPVKSGRGGERHPLATVLNEIKTRRGDVQIDLDAVDEDERRRLVDGLIDLFPNEFDEGFRAALFAHTDGLPLFTFELLRELRDRGSVTVDGEGRWSASPKLDWSRLPQRVEGIVEERFARLDEGLRDVLSVASAEGVTFTAQVLARVLGEDLRRLVRTLAFELGRRHGLIQEGAMKKIGDEWRSEFRFTSAVFQQYAYGAMTRTERTLLHGEIAIVLEELYGAEDEGVVALLARQYELGGEAEKAIHLLLTASRIAEKMRAYSLVLRRFRRILKLLSDVASSDRRSELELAARLAAGNSLMVARGFIDPETRQNFERASDLCRREQKTEALFQPLLGLWQCEVAGGELRQARRTGEELLALARGGEPGRLAHAHRALGEALMYRGELTAALRELEDGIQVARQAREEGGMPAVGIHPEMACLCFAGWTCQALGKSDRALRRMQEAMPLAVEISPFQQTFVLAGQAYFHSMRREMELTEARAAEVIALSQEHGFPFWQALGHIFRGASRARGAGREEGLAEMRGAIESFLAGVGTTGVPFFLALEAELRLHGGQIDEPQRLLEEALELAARTGDQWWEGEIERLLGEVCLRQGDVPSARAKLESALASATERKALMLELRATVGLARLLDGQGEAERGKEMLESVLGRFTEGASTPDQQEARALLAELSP